MIRKEYFISYDAFTSVAASEFDKKEFTINANDLAFIDVNNLDGIEHLTIEKNIYDENENFLYTEDLEIFLNYDGIAKYLGIPKNVVIEIFKNKCFEKSPYSNSFYNSKEIGWNSKPEGSLRISDHWNFNSLGDVHCKLKNYNEEEPYERWLLCKYSNGEYEIIKEL